METNISHGLRCTPVKWPVTLFCCHCQHTRDRLGANSNPCRKLLATLEITPDDGKKVLCLPTSAYPSAQPLKIRHITDKRHNNSFFLTLYRIFTPDELPMTSRKIISI